VCEGRRSGGWDEWGAVVVFVAVVVSMVSMWWLGEKGEGRDSVVGRKTVRVVFLCVGRCKVCADGMRVVCVCACVCNVVVVVVMRVGEGAE
jgi:hypothetical protein